MKNPALRGWHWPRRRPSEPAATGETVVRLPGSRLAPRWAPRRWLRAQGLPGVLGIGLLAMCGAFYLSALEPAESRLAEVKQSALGLRQQIAQAGADLKRDRRPVPEQLAEFYRLFPDEKELPDWLDKIFAAAQAQGLILEQGEYKTTAEKAGRLLRCEITLPVKGDYPQIRRFLSGLANDVPISALEQIQFERQKVGVATVDSKIRLVLYLEARP